MCGKAGGDSGFEWSRCWGRSSIWHSFVISSIQPEEPVARSTCGSKLTGLNHLMIAPGWSYLSLPVWMCVQACIIFIYFFLSDGLLSEHSGIPHAFPHPLQIDSEGATFRGLGADPRGWVVCSVLVGMSQGPYEITKNKNTVIYLCVYVCVCVGFSVIQWLKHVQIHFCLWTFFSFCALVSQI